MTFGMLQPSPLFHDVQCGALGDHACKLTMTWRDKLSLMVLLLSNFACKTRQALVLMCCMPGQGQFAPQHPFSPYAYGPGGHLVADVLS